LGDIFRKIAALPVALTVLLAMAVLLLWLQVGCAAGDDQQAGGQKQGDNVGGSSDQPQRAKQEEKAVSARPRQLTQNIELDEVRNGKIAFVKEGFHTNPSIQNTLNIYTMNADGSGQTRLTRDPAYYGNLTDPPVEPAWSTMYSPAWPPDGEKIAFLWGYRLEGHDLANSAIYVMEADGSDPALIKNFTGDDTSTFVPNLGWLPDH